MGRPWNCDGCGELIDHDGKESFHVETKHLRAAVARLHAANEELRTEIEGHLVFWRIGGDYRCKGCMVVAPGDPVRAGHAPKPYPHDERCIIKRAGLSESVSEENK